MNRSRWISSVALAALAIAPWSPLAARPTTEESISPQLLVKRVGRVANKCCLPGRRWGCDPANLSQSGCKSIRFPLVDCQGTSAVTMKCTGAVCQTASSEDYCEHDFVTVGHNQCRPTGMSTTVGCPADEWQCLVIRTAYWTPGAPQSDVYICDDAQSTICTHNYSDCH